MSLTTEEAAARVGVSPITVRGWVRREQLQPIIKGVKPLRFREADVVECHLARQPEGERDRIARLAEAWRSCTDANELQR